jgi:hypothetical protein
MTTQLEKDIADLEHAVNALQQWQTRQTQLVNKIAAALKHDFEGGKTYKINDDLKVAVTLPFNRHFDLTQWQAIESEFPENARPIKTKIELDKAGFEWYRDDKSEESQKLFQLLCKAVTTTPGKPAVKITRKQPAETVGELPEPVTEPEPDPF